MFSLSDGLTAIIQLDYGTIKSRDRTQVELLDLFFFKAS